jgi:hypothetical protein
LTPETIAAAVPRAQAYKLSDGGSVHLLVTPTGAKYWRLKYRLGGKEKQLSLGVYPDVSLDALESRSRRAIRSTDG